MLGKSNYFTTFISFSLIAAVGLALLACGGGESDSTDTGGGGGGATYPTTTAVTAGTVLHGGSTAIFSKPSVVFNGAGEGVLVAQTEAQYQTSLKLIYQTFDGAGTWSSEEFLVDYTSFHNGVGYATAEFGVVTDGTKFLIHWGDGQWGAFWDSADGLGATFALAESGAKEAKVIGGAPGFAVIYGVTGSAEVVKARIYSGSAWDTTQTINLESGTSAGIDTLVVATSSADFAFAVQHVWNNGSLQRCISAARSSGGTWPASVEVVECGNANNTVGGSIGPYIVSNGTGFLAGWQSASTWSPLVSDIKVSLAVGTAAFANTPTTLPSDLESDDVVGVASDGTGYLVVTGWGRANRYYDTGGGTFGWTTTVETYAGVDPSAISSTAAGEYILFSAFGSDVFYTSFKNSVWDGVTTTVATSSGNISKIAITSGPSGSLGLIWSADDAGVLKINGGRWASNGSVFAWESTMAGTIGPDTDLTVQSGARELSIAYNGADGFFAAWSQSDFAGDSNVWSHDIPDETGGSYDYSLASQLIPANHVSEATKVRMVSNSSGDVLAIWYEYNQTPGKFWAVKAAGGTTWTSPSHMAGSQDWYPISSGTRLYALASEPGGGAVTNIRHVEFTGSAGVWSVNDGAPLLVTTAGHVSISMNPWNPDVDVVDMGGGKLAVIYREGGSGYVYTSLFDGSTWTGNPVSPTTGSDSTNLKGAMSGGNLLVTWSQDYIGFFQGLYANVYDGSSWEAANTTLTSTLLGLDVDSNPFSQQIASDGNGGFAVAWNEVQWVNDGYISIHDGSAWGTADHLLTNGTVWGLSGNASGYASIWSDQGADVINGYSHDGSGWSVAETLITGFVRSQGLMAANTADHFAALPVYSSFVDSLMGFTFDGTTWGNHTLNTAEFAYLELQSTPKLAAGADSFAVGWANGRGVVHIHDAAPAWYEYGTDSVLMDFTLSGSTVTSLAKFPLGDGSGTSALQEVVLP